MFERYNRKIKRPDNRLRCRDCGKFTPNAKNPWQGYGLCSDVGGKWPGRIACRQFSPRQQEAQ